MKVAIIGGGYAGLACGVELANKGAKVTLFEKSRTLGGRARVLEKDGYLLDNGQHILLGAYHELLRLLRMVGQSPKAMLDLPLTLSIPGQLQLTAASLPAPLHLALGLLRAHGLSFQEKLAAIRLLRWLKHQQFAVRLRQDGQDVSVRDLLTHCQQPERLIRLLWEPLALAALNTPISEASAQAFACVLRDSLAGASHDSHLLIPKTNLSDLFPVPAARYIAMRQGLVRTMENISGIDYDGQSFQLRGDGRSQRYDHVVIASAPYHAQALLESLLPHSEQLLEQVHCHLLDSEQQALQQSIATLAGLHYEPIATIWLDYGSEISVNGQSRPMSEALQRVFPIPMLSQPDGPMQWVFNRQPLGNSAGVFAGIISAHGAWEDQERDALLADCDQQLRALFARHHYTLPAPCWQQVVVEKRATFACTYHTQRPSLFSGLPGVWLTGDYVASEYPGTLETAVRNGVNCARNILSSQ